MLGSFSVTKLLGPFLTLGSFFFPVELVSDEVNAAVTVTARAFCVIYRRERSQRHRFGALLQLNKCLYTFDFIYKVFTVL